MASRSVIVLIAYLLSGSGLTWLSHTLDQRLKTETGLVQTFDRTQPDRRRVFRRITPRVDLTFLNDDPSLPVRFIEVRWNGVWNLPEGGQVDLFAGGDDFVGVRIDGELVIQRHPGVGMSTESARVTLDPGLHRLSVQYLQEGGGYSLNVQWAPAGGRPRPFDPERLFPRPPEPEQLVVNGRLRMLRATVMGVWIVPPLLLLLWVGWPTAVRIARHGVPAAAREAWAWYDAASTGFGAGSTRTATDTKRSAVLVTAAAVALFGLPLFYGLGSQDLHNDEAIYSYAVDRIVETGEWLTPELIPHTGAPGDPGDHTEPFLEKPPLKFWIVTLPMSLGLLPRNEFGLRFWDALIAVAAFGYVFLIGRRLVDWVCGAAAVFLLFVHVPLMFGHGLRSNVMEAPLVLAYAGGMYHFLAWSENEGAARWRHILAFAGWFTLGFMTKFVAALFLPMVVGLAALGFPDWRRRLWTDRWRWAAGILVALVLIVPWFAYEHVLFGSYFWDTIFGAHVYDRMRGTLAPEHAQPWSFYFDQLRIQLRAGGMLWWAGAGSALWLLESIRRRSKAGALILAWYIVPMGIISFSVAKLYHYSFPFLLPVALLGAFPAALLVRLASVFHDCVAKASWASRVPHVRYAAFAVPLTFLIYAWPMLQYGRVIESFGRPVRPLSALRACLVDGSDRLRLKRTDSDWRSRLYVHLPRGVGLTHNYYYYFRSLDEWERLESASDAHLYARLFVPGRQAPTVIFEEDYESFLLRIRSPALGEELRALASGSRDAASTTLADDPASVLREGSLPAAVRLGRAGTTQTLILLPGPLATCQAVAVGAGGQAFEAGTDL